MKTCQPGGGGLSNSRAQPLASCQPVGAGERALKCWCPQAGPTFKLKLCTEPQPSASVGVQGRVRGGFPTQSKCCEPRLSQGCDTDAEEVVRGVPGWQSQEPDAQHRQPRSPLPSGPHRWPSLTHTGATGQNGWRALPPGTDHAEAQKRRCEEEVPVPGEGWDQLPQILSHLEGRQGPPTLPSLPRLVLPGAPAQGCQEMWCEMY